MNVTPKSTESSRSWFCTWNNPQKQWEDLSPEEMVNKAIALWCEGHPERTCGINYEIGDEGTPHMHMVLEDPAKTRFSTLQKLFKGIHVEPTRGSKEAALDYINKVGRFEEKSHTVVVPAVIHGEIKANRGKRKDIEIIQELLEQGKTPNEIMDISISYRQYEKLIKGAYYRLRKKNTPLIRDVTVYYHVGESGSGKSYTYAKICDKYGDDSVYMLNDYEGGGFDLYTGEPVLFIDDLKGNIRYEVLLNLTDKYRDMQVHSRYHNNFCLWNEVHITSIYAPEELYKQIVSIERRDKDPYTQFLRRISYIVYHYKKGEKYLSFEIPVNEYKDYYTLKNKITPPEIICLNAEAKSLVSVLS